MACGTRDYWTAPSKKLVNVKPHEYLEGISSVGVGANYGGSWISWVDSGVVAAYAVYTWTIKTVPAGRAYYLYDLHVSITNIGSLFSIEIFVDAVAKGAMFGYNTLDTQIWNTPVRVWTAGQQMICKMENWMAAGRIFYAIAHGSYVNV